MLGHGGAQETATGFRRSGEQTQASGTFVRQGRDARLGSPPTEGQSTKCQPLAPAGDTERMGGLASGGPGGAQAAAQRQPVEASGRGLASRRSSAWLQRGPVD